MTDLFESLFPSIFQAIQRIKSEFGYKTISLLLQRMESALMIDGVCRRLVADYPDVPFLTIHDSAIAVIDTGGVVRKLIKEEFERYGLRVTVNTKINLQNIENDT